MSSSMYTCRARLASVCLGRMMGVVVEANAMSDADSTDGHDPSAPGPAGPYWEDPVYRYVSRRHRSALAAGDDAEAERFDALMQQLANAAMPDELYRQLDAEAGEDRKRRKQSRKRRAKPPAKRPPDDGQNPSVNVADLKRRIYNPHVSRENVIKALEALPTAERRSTIAGLPPGLRRKLGDYLKGRQH